MKKFTENWPGAQKRLRNCGRGPVGDLMRANSITWEDSRMHQSTDHRFIEAPKVLLHDHLDGGVRAPTILEIAAEVGHALPASDADSLDRWFRDSADSGSLNRYLETFEHTLAVMQRRGDLVGEEPDLWKRCVRVGVDHRQWQQLREPRKRVRLQHAMPARRTISPT